MAPGVHPSGQVLVGSLGICYVQSTYCSFIFFLPYHAQAGCYGSGLGSAAVRASAGFTVAGGLLGKLRLRDTASTAGLKGAVVLMQVPPFPGPQTSSIGCLSLFPSSIHAPVNFIQQIFLGTTSGLSVPGVRGHSLSPGLYTQRLVQNGAASIRETFGTSETLGKSVHGNDLERGVYSCLSLPEHI